MTGTTRQHDIVVWSAPGVAGSLLPDISSTNTLIKTRCRARRARLGQAEAGLGPNLRMGRGSSHSVNLSQPRAEYDRKVRDMLPTQARASGNWPIEADHCFARVVPDNLFGDVWYDHIDGRPGYKHLSQKTTDSDRNRRRDAYQRETSCR
jgi:hypothetical protein